MKISMLSVHDGPHALITTMPMKLKINTTAGISNQVTLTGKLLVVWAHCLGVVTTKRNNTAPWLPFTVPV
jgi:hypothetical protein